MNNSPWDDPFESTEAIVILWDYENQVIVGEGLSNLFDTCWTYYHTAGAVLPWRLSRFPGDSLFLREEVVPDMVRLAVMVME